jgi:hypothetical protein
LVYQSRLGLSWPSRLFQTVPGAKVDDAQEGSWSRSSEELVLLDNQAFSSGVDVDGTSCLLRRPTAGGCQPSAQSLWFGKVLPCLVAKPFLGVTALMGPHATMFRSGPRVVGPTLSGLITPCGAVPSLDHPYPWVCKLLRWFALL